MRATAWLCGGDACVGALACGSIAHVAPLALSTCLNMRIREFVELRNHGLKRALFVRAGSRLWK
jgi:hypothetical protein